MAVFLTDLDHTMIYSHRHETTDPVVWVEYLKGRPQSYMTKETYEYFLKQPLSVLPVTTRTIAQYERLRPSFEELGWQDALVCNGAVLLHGGIEDEVWHRESEEIARRNEDFFNKALDTARRLVSEEQIVRCDPFLFYIKTPESEKIRQELKDRTDPGHLSVLCDARKVYVIPDGLDKGSALRRYRTRLGEETIWAAGDSLFDIPMLVQADLGFCPEELVCQLPKELIAAGNMLICPGRFSDEICRKLEKVRSLEIDR